MIVLLVASAMKAVFCQRCALLDIFVHLPQAMRTVSHVHQALSATSVVYKPQVNALRAMQELTAQLPVSPPRVDHVLLVIFATLALPLQLQSMVSLASFVQMATIVLQAHLHLLPVRQVLTVVSLAQQTQQIVRLALLVTCARILRPSPQLFYVLLASIAQAVMQPVP